MTFNGTRRTGLSDYRFGILLVVVSAVTYSTAGVFTKGVGAGPWEVIFWRGVFAAGFTIAWTVHRGAFVRNFAGIGTGGWAVAIVASLGTAAFISSFKYTTIANVSLIYATTPLLAALFAWLAIGERVAPRTAAGCAGALAGVAIIVSGSLGRVSLTGDLLALGMTVAMATIMVLYRAFPRTPAAGPQALSSLLLLPVAMFFGDAFAVAPQEIAVLAAFGLLFAIASVTLAEGSKRVPSGQTALLSTLETPLAPVFAFLLLAEVPGMATWLGGTAVLLAVLWSLERFTDS